MESYFLDDDESQEEEKLDLRRYYRALRRRWWLVLLVALLVAVPWVFHLKSLAPVYEAQALIRFKNFGGNDLSLVKTRYTELTSRSFAEKVVAQLGLSMVLQFPEDQRVNRSDIFKDFTTTKSPVPGRYVLHLAPDQTYSLSIVYGENNTRKEIKSGNTADITKDYCVINGMSFILIDDYTKLPSEIPFGIHTFRYAVQGFRARIRVNWRDRAGTLMMITLFDHDRFLAAEMTNRLAEIFIKESASLKKESVKSKREIYEEQLQIVEDQLNESELALKRFREQYTTNLNADQKNRVASLTGLDKQKQNLESTIETLKELQLKKDEQLLATNGNGTDPSETYVRIIMNQIANHPVFNENAAMLSARGYLGKLEKDYDTHVSRTTAENFKAKQLLDEIKNRHIQIESISMEQISELEADLAKTKRDIGRAESRLRSMPTQQYKLTELTRKNQVLGKQYTDLLTRTRDAQITEAVETEDIEILDSALVPDFPSNRAKNNKAILGGAFGLFLGLGVVLLLEFMDKSIKTVEDIKSELKLPVLGTIPQMDFSDTYEFQDSEKIKQVDQQLVTHDYSPTPIGEAYRSLRTNLLFTKDTGRINSLVLTSNEPGDGKSFTAANLTITLAQLKSNTLLIDADLRRGVLHNTFGVNKEPGFSNYLTDVAPLQTILQETQIPNLTLISCGSMIPNPSELLGSHQMQRFLDEVRRKFDLIVFDTPPLNAATDAVVVGTQTDATVIVLRAGKTDRSLAKQKLELFSSVPANVIGTILNGTTEDMAHPGYSYYHY